MSIDHNPLTLKLVMNHVEEDCEDDMKNKLFPMVHDAFEDG
jgi:hypothetical protein